jgi:hypothetical protein
VTADRRWSAVCATFWNPTGHFVKVDLRAETKPNMPADSYYSINAAEFSTVGEDGLTESQVWTGPSIGCLDESEQFPSGQLAPGSKYRNSIVIERKTRPGCSCSSLRSWAPRAAGSGTTASKPASCGIAPARPGAASEATSRPRREGGVMHPLGRSRKRGGRLAARCRLAHLRDPPRSAVVCSPATAPTA